MAHAWVLITLVSWGIAGIFDKRAVENGTNRATFLSFHLFNVPLACVLLVALPMFLGQPQLNTGVVLWELLDAIVAMAAILVYYQALSRTQASWVLGITAGYPIVGQALSFILLGEAFSWLALLSSAVVSAGVAAIGHSASKEHKALSRRDRWTLYSAVAACTLLWGLLGILDKKGTDCAPPMDGFLVVTLWKALFATALIPLVARGQTFIDLQKTRMWRWSWLASFCVAIGNVGFLLALPLLPTGYVIVVTAAYPLVMYVFALLVLREKLNPLRAAGILIMVAGLVLAEFGRQ